MSLTGSPIPCLNSSIALPASKSISNRALIIDALCETHLPINNLAVCDDTDVLSQALCLDHHQIDVGAAGTAMRFLTAFLARTSGTWLLTGSQRMKQRPIGLLVDALRELGAHITYVEKEGFPPLAIEGNALLGGVITLQADVSSQFVSALMLLAPTFKQGLVIQLSGYITSAPYIQLTASVMAHYGVLVKLDGNAIIIPSQKYQSKPLLVEADWSAASYWYALLVVNRAGSFYLNGLNPQSAQGDSKIVELFAKFGVKTVFADNGVYLSYVGSDITHFNYNFSNEPDVAQTFAVMCCMIGVTFHFTGLHTLKIKETDRLMALTTELRKLGFSVLERADSELLWDGQRVNYTPNPLIATYDDHRMAMAFAQAAIKESLIIENKQVVHKSYPQFWDEFQKIVKQINGVDITF